MYSSKGVIVQIMEHLVLYKREHVFACTSGYSGAIVVDGIFSLIKEAYEIYFYWTPWDVIPTPLPFKINSKEISSYRCVRSQTENGFIYVSFLSATHKGEVACPILEFRQQNDYQDLWDILIQYFSIILCKPNLYSMRRNDPHPLMQSFESLDLFPDSRVSRASDFSFPNSSSIRTRDDATRITTDSEQAILNNGNGGNLWSNIAAASTSIMRSLSPMMSQRPNASDASSKFTSVSMRDLMPANFKPFQAMSPQQSFGDFEPLYHPLLNLEESTMRTTPDDDLGFEVVTKAQSITLPALPKCNRSSPLTQEQWRKHLDEAGNICNVDVLMQIIFHGGIEKDLRNLVWKYLLGYYRWNFTSEENAARTQELRQAYLLMKQQWISILPEQEKRNSLYRERKSLIEKDVSRTDRTMEFFKDTSGNLVTLHNILMTYAIYNFDLGYVQGMNDLLAPILIVMNDEVDAFWCFAGFMDKMQDNFEKDQTGIKRQFVQLFEILQIIDPEFSAYLTERDSQTLLFTFRWLLIHFKREFSYEQIYVLWEVLWTECFAGANFHLLVAVAIITLHRQKILDQNLDFNNILKYVNDLAYHMDVEKILAQAESHYHQLHSVKRHLPPELNQLLHFSKDNF